MAVSATVAGAALCAWLTLCLLFWQGSWQLLYRPTAKITRVPTDRGVPFGRVGFAATETGLQRIQGWWVPAPPGPLDGLTILYLHGAKGNLSDCVEDLARLHATGVNVLAFDYRGYGQSQFARPSEARWLEDANWALDYLVQTRHTNPHAIVVEGNELGANLAVVFAAGHPEVAGLVVNSPIDDPASVIFRDSRASLIPAHFFVKDSYDVDEAAPKLRIPSLWLLPSNGGEPSAFGKIRAPRQLVRLSGTEVGADSIARWLADLSPR